jgi:hypothetical protein
LEENGEVLLKNINKRRLSALWGLLCGAFSIPLQKIFKFKIRE